MARIPTHPTGTPPTGPPPTGTPPTGPPPSGAGVRIGRLVQKLPTSLTPAIRRLAVASLVGQIVLVVSGGAVRLTASGLGCPTWPRCTSTSLVNTPEMGIHGVIEFGNRLLAVALAAVALAMLVYLWRLRRERRDLFLLSLGLLASVPAQAVLGGITVLTHLNPWVVGLHLIVSIILVIFATLLVNRAWGRAGRDTVAEAPPVRYRAATIRQLLGVIAVCTALAIAFGVMVTGSGPHAGDAMAPRNGLNSELITKIHAVPVYVLVISTIVVVLLVYKRSPMLRHALLWLFAIEILQAVIGFVQHFTGLPVILVGLHMLGASVLTAAATNAVDIGYKRSPAPRRNRGVRPRPVKAQGRPRWLVSNGLLCGVVAEEARF